VERPSPHPRQRYIRGCVLNQTRKTDSNISPILLLSFTGGKKARNFASDFNHSSLRVIGVSTEGHKLSEIQNTHTRLASLPEFGIQMDLEKYHYKSVREIRARKICEIINNHEVSK